MATTDRATLLCSPFWQRGLVFSKEAAKIRSIFRLVFSKDLLKEPVSHINWK